MFKLKKKTTPECTTPPMLTVVSPKEEPVPEEEWVWVEGYKGTDKNMCCRDYQYELGKKYDMPEDEKIIMCESGFHLCLDLNDVFSYYDIGYGNRFFKVKALVRKSDKDKYGTSNECSDVYGRIISFGGINKLVAKSIIFQSELTIDEILEGFSVCKLAQEYKQMAIDYGIDCASTNYKRDTLIQDGYSLSFTEYIVSSDKFDIAHAVGSQKDLSMDVKVLFILSKGELK